MLVIIGVIMFLSVCIIAGVLSHERTRASQIIGTSKAQCLFWYASYG